MLDNTTTVINRPLPRMRIAKDCHKMIHQTDPDSRVSLTYIRQLANERKIPVHYAGRRCLINYDALLDYLANPEQVQADQLTTYGIRPVPQRLGAIR